MSDQNTDGEGQPERKKPVAHLAEFSGYVIKITTAWSIIVAGASYLFWPSVEPFVELPESLERLSRRVGVVEREVSDLRPVERVAEYDMVRSGIEGDTCKAGEWCEGVYRVRRTDFGFACEEPRAQAFVTNHGGASWPVRDIEVDTVRAGSNWVNVPFRFRVPGRVQEGDGEFYYDLAYDCPAMTRRESSPPLVFEITR